MSLRDEVIEDAAEAFDEVAADLLEGSRFFLLRRAGETSQFSVIYEVMGSFWSRWDPNREQSLFMWASASAEWPDRVAQMSHVGFGVPDGEGKIDVFVINPDQRDRIGPSGGSVLWKLFGSREPSLRFTVPD